MCLVENAFGSKLIPSNSPVSRTDGTFHMTLYLAAGSPTDAIQQDQLAGYLEQVLQQLGPRQRVLAVPPDFTRFTARQVP